MPQKQIDQLIHVKGCTVYNAPDGIPEEFPATIDAEVTLPTIEHPTATMQAMGDTDIVDQTRVNSMETTISCEAGVVSSKLYGYGVRSYVIRWAQQMKEANGNFRLVPFVAYVSGTPRSDGGIQVQVGNNTTAQLTINTLKYRLLSDGQEIKFVDKLAGVLRIDGVDYREELNAML